MGLVSGTLSLVRELGLGGVLLKGTSRTLIFHTRSR